MSHFYLREQDRTLLRELHGRLDELDENERDIVNTGVGILQRGGAVRDALRHLLKGIEYRLEVEDDPEAMREFQEIAVRRLARQEWLTAARVERVRAAQERLRGGEPLSYRQHRDMETLLRDRRCGGARTPGESSYHRRMAVRREKAEARKARRAE